MNTTEMSMYLRKHIDNTLTDEERLIFLDEVSKPENQEVFAQLLTEMFKDPQVPLFFDEKRLPILENVMMVDMPEVPKLVPKIVHRVHFLRRGWLRYAAALILVAGLGVLVWRTTEEKDIADLAGAEAGTHRLLQEPTLTLADGRKVPITSVNNQLIANQTGAVISMKDGQLVYDGVATSLSYNTMSTPRGRTFQLQLPDGTIVLLNSASSIRYPVHFGDQKREVEINGEAFFDVAKNKDAPFLVHAPNGTLVEVLGTTFNINSYADEKLVSATVMSGSVRVGAAAIPGKVLQAGQQAVVDGSAIRLRSLDQDQIDQVVAWRTGFFNFNDVSVAEAMRQLERWYDIDVAYEKEIPNIHFVGEISRKTDIKDVLTFLEKAHVRFRLEGRKLIVLP